MLHEQFKDVRTKYNTRPDKKKLSIIDAESRKIINLYVVNIFKMHGYKIIN